MSADMVALLDALATYRAARIDLLEVLGCAGSNRDPFAEFAERIALAAIGGTMAASRTQKGWDFTDPEGHRVQVRYLANPAGPWVNEHLVDFRGDHCDRYALLVIEGFEPKTLLVFEASHMAPVCSALAKRHGDQEHTLQLTQRNYKDLLTERAPFSTLGVVVVDLTSGETV
jgi:hypothetical protein